MDVCPSPQDRVCRGCGTANPGPDHQCNPCCQLCGGEHLTADRKCKARFKLPYIVKRRRWERQRQREEELLASEATREAIGRPSREARSSSRPRARSRTRQSRSRSRTPAPARPRSRSHTPGPPPQRSRSQSRSRGSGLAAEDATYKVGWVDVVKGSSRRGGSGETAAFREMAEMRRENAQLRELIANLTREIQELKNNRKADVSPRPSSSHGGAAAETPDNRMEEDDNPPPPKRKAPAVISQTGSQLTDLGQKLTEMQSALKDQAEAVGNLTLAISTIMSRLDKFENNVATLSLRVAKLQPVTTAGAPTTGVASNQFQNAATSTAAVSGVVQSTTPQSSTSRTEQNRQTR
ncbi:hypothetical protein HPB52_025146 [Rhipicephalus sanguineus]|uniref:Uncharacterized protein n=1 Tax=Rhipicephalus sanguineus TaxID=34632 RepID=A0A9D4TDF8_RHISA|nr:hypothetical protein HPB52_025146 [Rhipicephalus sanguineus]